MDGKHGLATAGRGARTWLKARSRGERAAALATVVVVVIVAVALAPLFLAPAASPSPSTSPSGGIAVATPTVTAPPSASPSPSPTPAPTATPTAAPSPTPSPSPTPAWRPTTFVDTVFAAAASLAGPIGPANQVNGTWALTGRDLRLTSNGGATWTRAPLPAAISAETNLYEEIAVIDTTHFWVLDQAPTAYTVYRTANAGATWQAATIQGTFEHAQASLLFADLTHGFVVSRDWDAGGTSVYATADGGLTWKVSARHPQIDTTLVAGGPTTIWGISSGGGGMCFDCGMPLLQVTRDSGGTWTNVALPGFEGALSGGELGVVAFPSFLDASHGFVAVHRWQQTQGQTTSIGSTTVFATSDDGRTWSKVATIPYYVYGFTPFDARNWTAVAASNTDTPVGTIATADAGKTWQQVAVTPTGLAGSDHWYGRDGTGGTLAYPSAGWFGSPAVYLTPDRGRTWKPAWFGSWPTTSAMDDDMRARSLCGMQATFEFSGDWTAAWDMLSDFSKKQLGPFETFVQKQHEYAETIKTAGLNVNSSTPLSVADGKSLGPAYADAMAVVDASRGQYLGLVYGNDIPHTEQVIVAPLKGTQSWRIWVIAQG